MGSVVGLVLGSRQRGASPPPPPEQPVPTPEEQEEERRKLRKKALARRRGISQLIATSYRGLLASAEESGRQNLLGE